MGRASEVAKWIGGKAVDGVRAGGSAIGKKIDESMEEQKRKQKIYKDEYQKALAEERGRVKKDKDEVIRRKAREDAKRKVLGVNKKDA